MTNTAGDSITDDIRRGAKLAPVLVPKIWSSPNGKFGLSFKISLKHGIRVDSNPEQTQSGGRDLVYAFKKADNKRKSDDIEESAAKRVKVE